ncbi:FkbM family methyltransferase [Patescibacteria group bacterium]
MNTSTRDVKLNNHPISVSNKPEYRGFWNVVDSGNWEQFTFKVFDRFLSESDFYIDVGSWIGPTVIYGALLKKKVYAIEPNPIAFGEMTTNLGLNPDIEKFTSCHQICIAESGGVRKFGNRKDGKDSKSSLLFSDKQTTWTVKAKTLSDFVSENALEDVKFIKMDVEGGEKEILKESADFLRTHKPSLYLSLHAPYFHDKTKYLNDVFDVLSCYKYIYDEKGKSIKLSPNSFIRKIQLQRFRNEFSSILATDTEWHSA